MNTESGRTAFLFDLDGTLDADREALLTKLAGELLANPVIEDYQLQVEG